MKLLNHTKIEYWSHARLATLTFTQPVQCVLQYWRKIPPYFDFYVVTCSYSSHRSYALLGYIYTAHLQLDSYTWDLYVVHYYQPFLTMKING